MKQWNKLGVGIVALVLAVAVAGGAYAMWGGDDGEPGTEAGRDAGQGDGVESICLEGAEDCDDTIGDDAAGRCLPETLDCDDTIGGGAAGTCPEGTEDCVDADLGGAAGGTCLEGSGDCIDTPLGGQATGGGLAMCAPGVTDCVDVVVDPASDCVTEPGIDAEAITPEELERLKAACEQRGAECDDTPGARCLPPDCAVSSDGSISCPDENGGGEDGSAPGGAGSESNAGEPETVDPVAPNVDPAR
jgi:hypothetical protein